MTPPNHIVLYRLNIPSSVVGTTIPTDRYSKALRLLFGENSRAPKITPKDTNIGNPLEFATQVKSDLRKGKSAGNTRAIVVEILNDSLSEPRFDDAINSIYLALGRDDVKWPVAIVFVVSDSSVLSNVVLWNGRLVPLCEEKKTVLILLTPDSNPNIVAGNLPNAGRVGPLFAEKTDCPTESLSDTQLRDLIDVVFGHFKLVSNGEERHTTSLISVKRLVRNSTAIKHISTQLSRISRGKEYHLLPMRMRGNGTEELALALEGASSVLATVAEVKPRSFVIVFCDVVSPVYGLDGLRDMIIAAGASEVAIVGVVADRQMKSTSTLDFAALVESVTIDSFQTNHCKHCIQGHEPEKATHFDQAIDQLREFDPVSFWELVGGSGSFHAAGHWVSARTPNHYMFRILAGPLLRMHALGICIRIKNLLVAKGVIPTWVDGIVCADDPESVTIAQGLISLLGPARKEIVKIPRDTIDLIDKEGLDVSKAIDLNSDLTRDKLYRRNFIIVDQAAHSFRTLGVLMRILDIFSAKVLAFAVIVDRTHPEYALGEYLTNSHYVALYSWKVPPRREDECPCLSVDAVGRQ